MTKTSPSMQYHIIAYQINKIISIALTENHHPMRNHRGYVRLVRAVLETSWLIIVESGATHKL